MLESCWWPTVQEPGAASVSMGLPGPGRAEDWKTMVAVVFCACTACTVPLYPCCWSLCQSTVPLSSASRPRSLCPKWVKWSGDPRDTGHPLEWEQGRMECFLLWVYKHEHSSPWRSELYLVTRKHGPHLTTSVQANLPCLLGEVLALSPFWSLHKMWTPDSVSAGSRAPWQIISSKISFSISYWLWHLLCLLKHSADKNRNLLLIFHPELEEKAS